MKKTNNTKPTTSVAPAAPVIPEATSVAASPEVGTELNYPAIGLTKTPKGYAVYSYVVRDGEVVEQETYNIDPLEPYLSRDAAINLAKRKFVEMFVLEGADLEAML